MTRRRGTSTGVRRPGGRGVLATLAPLTTLVALAASAAPAVARQGNPAPAQIERTYAAVARRIEAAATRDSSAYSRLAELVDTFGPRLDGSRNLERAIDWIVARMKRDGLERVHTIPVRVPHWVRGQESLQLIDPRYRTMAMLGLGGSIGTPTNGIEAPVLVVRSFDDLRAFASKAQGRIVVFNAPFTTYGRTVAYRMEGAIEAAKVGAVAALVRSVTPFSTYLPHTGVMRYDSATPKIPAAAITMEDAALLQRMQDRGETPIVRLRMDAHTLPDAPSRDVVAQLTGREAPGEVVVLGGHIDSWDVGQGAMDDGGGAVVSWMAVKLLKDLGLRPRRTVRVVLWTDEEQRGAGAEAYYRAQKASGELAHHVLAIESDAGVFKPQGFGFTGSSHAFATVRAIGRLLAPIGAGTIQRGGGGADIGPLMRDGVPGMGLNVDGTYYFWYHHSKADTLDKLNPHEVALCVAAMAVMVYVAADLPAPLAR